MKQLLDKLKPASGFSRIVHLVLTMLLPLVVFVLVRIDFKELALSLILLSKWRMFAVRPRFWPAHVRANSVDLIVGVSIFIFMVNSGSLWVQFAWALLYGVWLLAIKPGSNAILVSLQAMIALLCGLMGLFIAYGDNSSFGLVTITGLICFLSARHFFDSFDEPYAKLLAYFWGYFGAALVWVLGHWLLFYGMVPQPVVLLLAIGYGLSSLYYLEHTGKLSRSVKRQFTFIMVAIVAIVLIFSDWRGPVV